MTPDTSAFTLSPETGAGAGVLCLHGLSGTPWEMRSVGEALARAGFACRGPLLPGHDPNAQPLGRVRRGEWLACALGVFDELAAQHGRVYVTGLSLGGLLALRLCTFRPVAGLAVLAAPLRFPAAIERAVRLLAPIGFSMPKRPGIADAEARRVHPGLRRMPLRAVRELLHLQEEVRATISQVTVPLRLIYSRGDRTAPPENAEWIARSAGSSDCTTHLVWRSSHVLPVDHDRDEIAQNVVGFFRELEGGAARALLKDAIDAE